MFLLRLLGLTLTPAPSEVQNSSLIDENVRVEVTAGPEREGARRYLVVGRISLPHRPKRTGEGAIVVPDRERVAARAAMESVANVMALRYRCRRQLSSPNPYIALEAEADEEHAWLLESSGIHGVDSVARQWIQHRLDLNTQSIRLLNDRWDGVALMSEALSSGSATGHFLELVRLFERAFRLPATKLPAPLSEFIDPRFRYSESEIEHWTVTLRGSTSHADQRQSFMLEADVRPHLARVEQAAWDVLLNKATWRDSSSARRQVWAPDGGTISPEGDIIVVQHSTPTIAAELLDQWEEFPIDLSGRLEAPESWWPGSRATMNTRESSVTIVSREEWEGRAE